MISIKATVFPKTPLSQNDKAHLSIENPSLVFFQFEEQPGKPEKLGEHHAYREFARYLD